MNLFEIGAVTATKASSYQNEIDLELVWPPRSVCARCQTNCTIEKTKIRRGINAISRCNNKECRARYYSKICPIFRGARISFSTILRLVYCFALNLTLDETSLHLQLSRAELCFIIIYYEKFCVVIMTMKEKVQKLAV
jgi:hypothetical protein